MSGFMYTAGTVGTTIFAIGIILGVLFLQHLLPGDKIALAYYVLPESGVAAALLILGIHQGYSSLKIRNHLDALKEINNNIKDN